MVHTSVSLLKFVSSTSGYGKVFKHKFINNFCDIKEKQGYTCTPLIKNLLLTECIYTRNEVDLIVFFNKIYPIAVRLTEEEKEYASTLLSENWSLSALDLIETIKTIA